VIECVPGAAKLVVQVAVELVAPATSATGEQGSVTPLSAKLTVPVGGSPATVAVSVTGTPVSAGVGVAERTTVVVFLFTMSVYACVELMPLFAAIVIEY
jgi:hypothetical protein